MFENIKKCFFAINWIYILIAVATVCLAFHRYMWNIERCGLTRPINECTSADESLHVIALIAISFTTFVFGIFNSARILLSHYPQLFILGIAMVIYSMH